MPGQIPNSSPAYDQDPLIRILAEMVEYALLWEADNSESSTGLTSADGAAVELIHHNRTGIETPKIRPMLRCKKKLG